MSKSFCLSGPSPFWSHLQIILAECSGHREGRQGPLDLLRVLKASAFALLSKMADGSKIHVGSGGGDHQWDRKWRRTPRKQNNFCDVHKYMTWPDGRFEKETFMFMLKFPSLPPPPLHITRCIESLQNNP